MCEAVQLDIWLRDTACPVDKETTIKTDTSFWNWNSVDHTSFSGNGSSSVILCQMKYNRNLNWVAKTVAEIVLKPNGVV